MSPVKRCAVCDQEYEEEYDACPYCAKRGARRTRAAVLALVAVCVVALAALALFGLVLPRGTVVPDVSGMRIDEAEGVLESRGLEVIVRARVRDEETPKDVVLEQEPTAGTRARKGSYVGLILSAGPEGIGVPNLLGLALGEAKAAIQALGLQSKVTTRTDGVDIGKVVSQSPERGARVLSDSVVQLVVGGPNGTPETGSTGQKPPADAAGEPILSIGLPSSISATMDELGEPDAVELPDSGDPSPWGQWFRWSLDHGDFTFSALGDDYSSSRPNYDAEVRVTSLVRNGTDGSRKTTYGFELGRTSRRDVKAHLPRSQASTLGDRGEVDPNDDFQGTLKYRDASGFTYFLFDDDERLVGVVQATFDMDGAD